MSQGTEREPLVTIIVPAYNRAGGLLEETLDSILGQDYANLECLVLDDGSTDQTPQVLERYAEGHPQRMRWERHENMGQAKTINRGFEMARGELIGYLNSDDLFLPGAIAKLAALESRRRARLPGLPDHRRERRGDCRHDASHLHGGRGG